MYKKWILPVICCFALFFALLLQKHNYTQYAATLQNQPITYENIKKQPSYDKENLQTMISKENTHKETKKTAYLTFDDGPSEITKIVLDALKQQNVKATFFLIGNSINKETESIVKRMMSEGHTIGIHSFSHKNSIYHSTDSYLDDFQKTSDKILQLTGQEPKIFRFPWGSSNQYLCKNCAQVISILEKKGYTYYDWNVSAEDSVGTPSQYSILHNIKKDYKKYKEPIILMHDSSINKLTAQLLPDIINMLKESNYQFDTLDHMDPPYQYPRD